jgi:hypothetical protein
MLRPSLAEVALSPQSAETHFSATSTGNDFKAGNPSHKKELNDQNPFSIKTGLAV